MNPLFSDFYGFTKWLYLKIYVNWIFYFDYWSFVHIFSGFTLLLALYAFDLKYKKTIFISLIVLWEVIEILFKYFALDIFKPEIFIDQFNDILIGVIAGYLTYLMIKEWKNNNKFHFSEKFLASLATVLILGFLWSGTYQSQQSLEIFYKTGLEFLHFLFWCGLLVAFLFVFFVLFHFIKKIYISLLALLLFYYAIIYSINYNFSYILLNNIIYIGFLIAPLIILIHYFMFYWLFNRISNFKLLQKL